MTEKATAAVKDQAKQQMEASMANNRNTIKEFANKVTAQGKTATENIRASNAGPGAAPRGGKQPTAISQDNLYKPKIPDDQFNVAYGQMNELKGQVTRMNATMVGFMESTNSKQICPDLFCSP